MLVVVNWLPAVLVTVVVTGLAPEVEPPADDSAPEPCLAKVKSPAITAASTTADALMTAIQS
jgi:hypothetical protein